MNIEQAKRHLGLEHLSDSDAFDLIHRTYYPNFDKSKLAGVAGVRLEPIKLQEKSDQGNFSRGFEVAARELPKTFGGAVGLVGDAIGSDGVRDFGMGIYKGQEEEKINALSRDSDSFSNVLEGKGDLSDFVGYGTGYIAGQGLQAVATGGLGAIIGKQIVKRGLAKALEKGIATSAGEMAAAQAAEMAIKKGVKYGAGTALLGSNYMAESGGIYGEAVEQADKEGRTLDGGDLARIAGSAGLAAGVDTVADALMLGRFLHGSGRAGLGALKEIPKGIVREAATEGVQTGIERYGAGKSLSDKEAIRDYVDSMALGGLGGGFGGAGSSITSQFKSTGDTIRDGKVQEEGALSRAANAGVEANAQIADKYEAKGFEVGRNLAENVPDWVNQLPEDAQAKAFKSYALSQNEDLAPFVRSHNAKIFESVLRKHGIDANQISTADPTTHKVSLDIAGSQPLDPVSTNGLSGMQTANSYNNPEAALERMHRMANADLAAQHQWGGTYAPIVESANTTNNDIPNTAGSINIGAQESGPLLNSKQSFIKPSEVKQVDLSLQNRDRSRPESVQQMQKMAQNPDYDRLGVGKSPNEAAPMIFQGGDKGIPASQMGRKSSITLGDGRKIDSQYAVVDASQVQYSHTADGNKRADYYNPLDAGTLRAINNGRSAAIHTAHEQGTAAQYVQDLAGDSDFHGVSSDVIRKIDNPMLVRFVSHNVGKLSNIGALSNPQSNLGFSASEQALNDAAMIDASDFMTGENGEIDSSHNSSFLSRFSTALRAQGADMAQLTDSKGRHSKQFIDRVRNAVFAKAYRDPDLISKFSEDADPDLKNIQHALSIAAPDFAAIDSTEAGELGYFVPRMIEAIGFIKESKAKGFRQDDALAQSDVFGRDELADKIVRFLWGNIKSYKRMGEGLRKIAQAIKLEIERSRTDDFFGSEPASLDDIIKSVNEKIINEYGKIPIFEQNTRKYSSVKEPDASTVSGFERGVRRSAWVGSGGGQQTGQRGATAGNEQGQQSEFGQHWRPANDSVAHPHDKAPPSEGLSTYDRAEILAKQKREAKALAQERNNNVAASTPNNFVLTGSDSEIDEAEARGQQRLFQQRALYLDSNISEIITALGQKFGWRSDANAQTKADAKSAVQSAVQRIGKGSIIANAISTDLLNDGATDLIGKKVTSAEDLATLAQVYRDPRFETARYFFVKQGHVVGHTGLSLRLPSVAVATTKDPEVYINRLTKQMRGVGADQIYMLHNHPSGDPTPSAADIQTTEYMAKHLPGFAGHVIIDSNKFAEINVGADGISTKVTQKYFGFDKTRIPSVPNDQLRKPANDPHSIALVGQSFKKSGFVTLIATDDKLHVQAVMELPESELKNPKAVRAQALIRRFARQTGASGVMLTGFDGDPKMYAPLIEQGFVVDAVSINAASARAQGATPLKDSRWLGKDKGSAKVVGEKLALQQPIKNYATDDLFADMEREQADMMRDSFTLEPSGSMQNDLFVGLPVPAKQESKMYMPPSDGGGLFDEAQSNTPEEKPVIDAFDALFDTIKNKDEGGKTVLYSQSHAIKAKFEQRIDELFAGTPANRVGATVLDKSDVLGLLGYQNKPVVLAESKVIAGQDNHPRMTAEVWKKVPLWLDNPAAVFESDTDEGLVFIAPELLNGQPVAMIIRQDSQGRHELGFHTLLNAYDRSAQTPFLRWFNDGLVRYIDKNKFPPLFEKAVGRQLPDTVTQNRAGMVKIVTEKNLAGYKKSQETATSATSAPAQTSTTPEKIKAAIESIFTGMSNAWDKISESTKVVTRDEAKKVIEGIKGEVSLDLENKVQAFFNPADGKIYLIADNIEAGTEKGVWLHEVFHKRGGELLDAKSMKKLQSVVTSWKNRPADSVESQIYEAAHQRATQAAKTQQQADIQASLTPSANDSTALAMWKLLAQNSDAFQLPKSHAKDIGKVVRDIVPEADIVMERRTNTTAKNLGKDVPTTVYRIILPDTKQTKYPNAFVYATDKQVWIDITGLQEGDGGRTIYQMIGDWAHNTGRVFIGDPNGLSDAAQLRRTDQMISSALRWGTTDHLLPHELQLNPSSEAATPFKWRDGDTDYNLGEMLRASAESVLKPVEHLGEFGYNFESKNFELRGNNGKTESLSEQDIRRYSDSKEARGVKAGGTTLKRAILTISAIRGEGQGRSRLLGQALRQSEQELDPALKKLLYSQSPQTTKSPQNEGFFNAQTYQNEFLAYAIEEAVNRGVAPDEKMAPVSAKGWLARVQTIFLRALKKLVKLNPANHDFDGKDLVVMADSAAGLEYDSTSMKKKSIQKTFSEVSREDYISMYEAMENIASKGRKRGMRIDKNIGNGTITIYHGTSNKNAESIRSQKEFTGNTWFASSERGTIGHSRPKHGKDHTVYKFKPTRATLKLQGQTESFIRQMDLYAMMMVFGAQKAA